MLFGKKKQAVPAKAPADHYSVAAVTRRTKIIRDRAENFAAAGSVSETATKEQLIYPLLEAFGWDIKDPEVAGFEVQAGGKNKADLMLSKDKAVKIVLEAKAYGRELESNEFRKQLKGYFENCHAYIGILTNGVQYDFFSFVPGSEEMDTRPFASVDIRNPRFGERNNFMMYLCRPNLDVDALYQFSKVRVAAAKLKHGRFVKDSRDVRAAFSSVFPSASPQKLDELIEFANYHCK